MYHVLSSTSILALSNLDNMAEKEETEITLLFRV